MSERRGPRRVGFRIDDGAHPSDTPDTSYMMLDDAVAERLAPNASETSSDTKQFPKLSAREFAHLADEGMKHLGDLGEMAKHRAAAYAGPIAFGARKAAKTPKTPKARKVPFLTSVPGLGGRRAPTVGPGDPDGNGEGGGGEGAMPGCTGAVRRNPDSPERVVFLNDEARNKDFPSNYIATTKYSLLTCVPMFLFEQFSRFSNAYFLVVGILFCIDSISPVTTVGRYASFWVLAVVVGISGIKEAIEDLRRYREDRRLNSSPTHVLGSAKTHDRWDSVRVGDILKIYEKEALPADIALVATSSADGLAHIETKQLDGESNLKVKVVPPGVHPAFRNEKVALLTKGRIESEAPNDRLYKFVGRLTLTHFTPPAEEELHQSILPTDPGEEAPPPLPQTAPVELNNPVPLGPENFMIRGSSLRNTEWVMGIVVNTGRDTKLMQNVKPRPRKNSRLERRTNTHYFYTVILQIIIVVALTIRSDQSCGELYGTNINAWYLGPAERSCSPVNTLLRFFTFFVTFAGLIPISLYVSMEVVRGFQVYFIENDSFMKDTETGTKTEVRTSNLNEELGVIHYVFTDKTGTLTANRMDFKKCSIHNKVYEWADVAESGATSMRDLQNALQAGPESSAIRDFDLDELEAADNALRLLAICHSVVAEHGEEHEAEMEELAAVATPRRGMRLRWPQRRRQSSESTTAGGAIQGPQNSYTTDSAVHPVDNGVELDNEMDRLSDEEARERAAREAALTPIDTAELRYQASSPDEAALVEAAKAHGYTFVSRFSQSVTIEVHGRVEHHQLLEVIEFDSTRKRMSVVTKDPEGKIRVYTKGADAVIFERLAEGQSSEVTEQHLHDFAVEGLRTLCLAYADLDKEWFDDWHSRYREAAGKTQDREENLARLADELETNLTLLGATAIEDKLQEGVPETLRKLEKAGVKVWVLTGDKQETAINIGLSCGAIEEGMDVVIINEDNVVDTSAQIDRAIGRWSALLQDSSWQRKLGIVLDGQTLHYALEPQLQKKLVLVCRLARTVIACRVSPKQKTELVELVRKHETDKVTLAIGDGANDVGMIQAAHVGIGIVGLEGQEAKLASDYSFGQFRFLARLMLVHGRWSYKRMAKMVLYTIYKNAILILCELYWSTQSAFSGQPLFDPWLIGIYSLLVTSLPPIILGILDQELTADYALMFPEVYMKGQRDSAFSTRVFISWLFASLWQSAIVYYITYFGFGDLAGANGQHLGMWAFGVAVFSIIIIDVHFMLLVYQSAWTKFTMGIFLISLVSWFLVGPVFSSKLISLDAEMSPPMFNVVHRIFAEPRFWFVLLVSPVLCVSPSLLWKYSKRRRRPNMKMLVQELIKSGKTREEITGELPKPLRRVPSYDPSAPATPSGPVRFVRNGEREYMFSGFNFDNDESEVVLRRGFELARGARRRRMRFLKRAGSDTELDVEGVKSAVRESPRVRRARSRGTFDHDPPDIIIYDDDDGSPHRARRRRPPRYPGAEDESPPVAPRLPRIDRGGALGAANTTAHRRAMSDGAVLAENQFERLERMDRHSGDFGSDSSE